MGRLERKKTVLDILTGLKGMDGLKELFWTELNYERENKLLSTRQWPDSAKQGLAEDPILFASGGEGNVVHVVYCRSTSTELKRGLQRLFFPGELHARKLKLFDETAKLNLPDLAKLKSADKFATLQELHDKAYAKDSTLRGMLFDLKSLDVVHVIENVDAAPTGDGT